LTDYFQLKFDSLYDDIQDLHKSIYYFTEPHRNSMQKIDRLREKYSGCDYAQSLLDALEAEAERLKAQKLGWLS
jgi:hypothetical protein